jgi:hypothetical protein
MEYLLHSIQVKVKLSLCFNWAPRHEGVLGEWRYSSTFLTSALDGGEWSASRPSHFTPRERTPGTHWTGSWVGPRASLDTVSKRKIPSPHRESNPNHPIVQTIPSHDTDWAIPALQYTGISNYYLTAKIWCCLLILNYSYNIHETNKVNKLNE